MTGIEPYRPGDLRPGDDAPPPGAEPIDYSDHPAHGCMEGMLERLPDRLRAAVHEHAPLDRLPANRWYASQHDSLFTFFALCDDRAVLASQDGDAAPMRRLFPIAPATLVQLGPDSQPPVPPRSPGAEAGPGTWPDGPEDAPLDWHRVFSQFPLEAQDLLLGVFPPTRRATRFVGACRAYDRRRERLWAFAGTKSEVVLLFADRCVPVDPVSPASTDLRRRRASWLVSAWRGQSVDRPALGGPVR
jgi:hypothetical protein